MVLETRLLLLPDTKVYPAGRQASMPGIKVTCRKSISVMCASIKKSLAVIGNMLPCVVSFTDGFNPSFAAHFRQVVG
jgi:hypothetical protein